MVIFDPWYISDVQVKLSEYQSTPIIGMVVSPFKALLSTAQIVAGLGAMILLGPVSHYTDNEEISEAFNWGFTHLFFGINGLAESIINIATLTLLCCYLEHSNKEDEYNASCPKPVRQQAAMPQVSRAKWDAVWVNPDC